MRHNLSCIFVGFCISMYTIWNIPSMIFFFLSLGEHGHMLIIPILLLLSLAIPTLLIQMLKKVSRTKLIYFWFLCTCCGSFRTLSDSCKFLSCLSVTFHWIFPSYSCAHMDRQLSETSNKICSFLRHIICKCCCLHIWILICWLSCIQDEAYNFHVCPCRVLWQDYSGLDINLKLPMIFI